MGPLTIGAHSLGHPTQRAHKSEQNRDLEIKRYGTLFFWSHRGLFLLLCLSRCSAEISVSHFSFGSGHYQFETTSFLPQRAGCFWQYRGILRNCCYRLSKTCSSALGSKWWSPPNLIATALLTFRWSNWINLQEGSSLLHLKAVYKMRTVLQYFSRFSNTLTDLFIGCSISMKNEIYCSGYTLECDLWSSSWMDSPKNSTPYFRRNWMNWAFLMYKVSRSREYWVSQISQNRWLIEFSTSEGGFSLLGLFYLFRVLEKEISEFLGLWVDTNTPR